MLRQAQHDKVKMSFRRIVATEKSTRNKEISRFARNDTINKKGHPQYFQKFKRFKDWES